MNAYAESQDIASIIRLYEHDPIGIAMLEDEYLIEATMITEVLDTVQSADAMLDLVRQTFLTVFGNLHTLGEPIYPMIAHALWEHFKARLDTPTASD